MDVKLSEYTLGVAGTTLMRSRLLTDLIVLTPAWSSVLLLCEETVIFVVFHSSGVIQRQTQRYCEHIKCVFIIVLLEINVNE